MDYIFSSANPGIKPEYYLIAVIIALLAGVIAGHCFRQKRVSKAQSVAIVLLAIYIFLVFASTVFSRVSKDFYSYELVPLWSYREILTGSKELFWENVLNIILLLPMGTLLSVAISADTGKGLFRKIVFSGFFTSFTIELLQLVLKRGLFEFDDIFHNTIGVAIGYWIYQKARKKYIL